MLRHQTVTRKVTFSGQGAHRLPDPAQNIFKRDAKNQHATRHFPKNDRAAKERLLYHAPEGHLLWYSVESGRA